MPSHIRPQEKARREVKRIARKRLFKARDALNSPARQRAKGIHQARKRIKELRALLRLVRIPLGAHYQRENQRLRDAARLLAELRDHAARVEAWDRLTAGNPGAIDEATVREIRRRLTERHPDMTGQGAQSVNQRVAEALTVLGSVEAAISDWTLRGKGFELFEKSLYKTLADGRKALKRALGEPTVENLHEWRKRVKDQWYQTRYLSSIWPALFAFRTAQLKQLAQQLGDDHDLSMLETLLHREPAVFGTEQQRALVAEVIALQRAHLRSDAFALGRRLFAESPSALCRRWKRYWRLAASEQRE